MCCRSAKDPFTLHCTSWSGKAGSPPSGSRQRITGARSFIRSRAWGESNSNRRRRTGNGYRRPFRWSSDSRRLERNARQGGPMRPQHWLYTIPLRLRSLFRSRHVEQELNEELQFHLEHKIEEGIAYGLSPKEARYAAMRAMDGLEQRKEEMRDIRRIHWLTDFVDDVHYAIRSLRRTPGLTAFVVMTLALGIGMTATPFSMVDGLVFRPYPVPQPGSVVSLVSTSHDNSFENFSFRE